MENNSLDRKESYRKQNPIFWRFSFLKKMSYLLSKEKIALINVRDTELHKKR